MTTMVLRSSSNRSVQFLLRGVSNRGFNGLISQNGNERCGGLFYTNLHTARIGGSSTIFQSYVLQSAVTSLKNLEVSTHSNSVRGVASVALAEPPSNVRVRGLSEIIRHYGRCYWDLSKARLSMLVVATSGAGFVLGSSAGIDWAGLSWTCAGTMMVAASANSFNQIFEVNNDAKMKRTMRRPLPSGRLSIPSAVAWAMTMGAAGSALLACKANILAAGLAASNLALYALIYTPLKQIHPINTWVGAVVGAIPPLLGWVAATGQVTLQGLVLPAVLYFWQIPHFMALAYLCRNDYAAGGFKMLSLLDGTGKRAALVALRNCAYLIPMGFVAYDWDITSLWFGLETVLLTSAMGAAAVLFYFGRNVKNARRLFHASLLYLPLLMVGMLFHRIPHSQFERATADMSESNNVAFTSVVLVDSEEQEERDKIRKQLVNVHSRPPVAYASIAPFPFLPAPMYLSSD